jgi:hypothetical protein
MAGGGAYRLSMKAPQLDEAAEPERLPRLPGRPAPPSAASCTCPEFCLLDHDN